INLRSSLYLLLERCTIKLIPHGPILLLGFSSLRFSSSKVISFIQSSSMSPVLAFKAGNVPIIPEAHALITIFGLLIKNIGAMITGRSVEFFICSIALLYILSFYFYSYIILKLLYPLPFKIITFITFPIKRA